ncbi:hypothetical protein [Spartinivicinus poritis]|uniref:Penicillin-binding protein activator LpoB n=1 Tax=Spartinivicinus poritis TaxID=2994640 RepID=A0ABT5UD10_9GAMM|nr:hypothetical protein [Spartinivicinus sp. A2-2]MDE1463333.1 hypothetical protein [Spartinivicinus sp. A2-2]
MQLKPSLKASLLLSGILTMTGCSSLSLTNLFGNDELAADANWVLVPIVNFSPSTDADEQVERMMAVLTPSIGLKSLKRPPDPEIESEVGLLDDANRIQAAKEWAKSQDFQYSLTGKVLSWNDADADINQPAMINLTLEVYDLKNDELLWTISGSSEGMRGQSVYEITRPLISSLLTNLPLKTN